MRSWITVLDLQGAAPHTIHRVFYKLNTTRTVTTMNRREMMLLGALASGVSAVSPVWAQFDLGKALDAGKGLAKAQSISDEELKGYFDQMAADSDSKNRVAGAGDPYGRRLANLSKGLASYDGLALDIKAYLVTDINAFAMANGTIRIFAGLMDKFTDDEVLYVIGHEIGHVKAGHTKARIQTAMRTVALKNAASAAGGKTAVLAESELGDLFEKVVKAQHSQANERQADDYAMKFMKANQFSPAACVSALEKLDALSGGGGTAWLSTHPSPKERAVRMKSQLA
jgi:metalloprotease